MIWVLAVAPEVNGLPRLAAADELARVGDVPTVRMQVLLDATRQRIIDRLSREPFDVLLWVGHGGPGELLLQDDVIEPQWLAAQLTSYNVRLAVLSVCETTVRPAAGPSSLGFADVLPAAGIDAVTMSMAEVTDRAAAAYDVALLQALAGGVTLRQAHQVGVAAAQRLGGVQAPMLTPADGGGRRTQTRMDASASSDYRLNNTETLLRVLDGKMDGLNDRMHDLDVRMRLQEDEVKRLRADITELRNDVTGMRRITPEVPREWLLASSLVLGLILLLLLVVTLKLL